MKIQEILFCATASQLNWFAGCLTLNKWTFFIHTLCNKSHSRFTHYIRPRSYTKQKLIYKTNPIACLLCRFDHFISAGEFVLLGLLLGLSSGVRLVVLRVVPHLTLTTGEQIVECGTEDVNSGRNEEHHLPSSNRGLERRFIPIKNSHFDLPKAIRSSPFPRSSFRRRSEPKVPPDWRCSW